MGQRHPELMRMSLWLRLVLLVGPKAAPKVQGLIEGARERVAG